MPVESIAEDLLGLAVEVRDDLTVSGMLLPAERRILVRSDEPEQRRRFTIAHELGHWICQCLEGEMRPVYCRATEIGVDPEAKALEREANIFAANLLMPEPELRGVAHDAAPDVVRRERRGDGLATLQPGADRSEAGARRRARKRSAPIARLSCMGIRQELVTCAICGMRSTFTSIDVRDAEAAPDLDFRPAEPARSEMLAWTQRCATCGYCGDADRRRDGRDPGDRCSARRTGHSSPRTACPSWLDRCSASR